VSSICSRFSVAVHILALLHLLRDSRATSELIASSVGTNAVVIRRITGALARHGLVKVQPGVGGANLLRPLAGISLLEVYRAVEAVEEEGLFAIHEHVDGECQVGRHIRGTLTVVFGRAQAAMEKILANVTLADIVEDIEEKQAVSA
jgi:DNA-binding IscR family transcriptional regulator